MALIIEEEELGEPVCKEGELVKFTDGPEHDYGFFKFGVIKEIDEEKDIIILTCGKRDEFRNKENEIVMSFEKFLQKAERVDTNELLEHANSSFKTMQLFQKFPLK